MFASSTAPAKARLHTWVYASDMGQWIPNWTEIVEVKVNRHSNYVVARGCNALVFDRKTKVLSSHTPKKTCPDVIYARWPRVELLEPVHPNNISNEN